MNCFGMNWFNEFTSANELNNDLYQINRWAFQRKMSLNQHQGRQAQEIIFSRKIKKISHPSLRFINGNVLQTPYSKHLVIFLNIRSTIKKHLKVITRNVNKSIGLLEKLQKMFPRLVLITMYNAFVRPHLGLWWHN